MTEGWGETAAEFFWDKCTLHATMTSHVSQVSKRDAVKVTVDVITNQS